MEKELKLPAEMKLEPWQLAVAVWGTTEETKNGKTRRHPVLIFPGRLPRTRAARAALRKKVAEKMLSSEFRAAVEKFCSPRARKQTTRISRTRDTKPRLIPN